jgi:hypothetical protein
MRNVLIVLAVLLAGLALAQGPRQTVYTAGLLAEKLAKQGTLVDDPDAEGGRAFQVTGPLNLEQYGDMGVLRPGYFRFSLRMKLTEPAPYGKSVSVACWNPNGKITSFRNEASISGDDFPAVGQYVEISRDFRVGEKDAQYGIWLRGGWPGLRIARFSITEITPPAVEITRVWPDKLLYRLGEAGKVTVSLRNNTETPQTVRLVAVVESGLQASAGLYNADVTVPVPTTEQRKQQQDATAIDIPLPAQAEYGHTVTATLYPAGDKPQPPLGTAAEYFFTSNRPVQVGQYGGMGVANAYSAQSAESEILLHRRHYFPLLEFMFWAPCDLSLQTPPPGKDRWWSGQCLKQLSTAQMQEYIRRAHAHGMSCVSYADYNIVYSYRIVDVFREHPDALAWDVNDNLLAYGVKTIALQKREDDVEREAAAKAKHPFEAAGIYGPIAANPALMQRHGDQLEAGIKALDWDGYRWDDPVDYDRPMTDVFGRKAPYAGYTNANMIEYFRTRTRAGKPGALFGHNMDWNLEEHPDPAKNVPPYYTEFLRDDSFALQEAGTNFAMSNHWPWKKWARENMLAGMNAIRYGGHQYVIIENRGTALERAYQVAFVLAGSSHLSYGIADSTIPYLRLACRYSDLLYGDGMHFLTAPDATLSVQDGGALWWRDYARYRTVAPGRRVYYVHLFNPPTTEKMFDEKITAPAPVRDVKVAWTLPAGWKPTAAWHITADAPGGVESVVDRQPTCTMTTLSTGHDLVREALPLAGTTVTVPQVRLWSIVAVECSGPAEQDPSERIALPPAPALPDLKAPLVAAKAPAKPLGAFRDRCYDISRFKNYHGKLLALIDDANAAKGKAGRILQNGNVEMYDFPEGTMPAGTYRFSVRLRAEKALPANAKLTVSAWSPNNLPKAFRVSDTLDVSGLTPEQGYRTFACELKLGDARVQTGVQLAGLLPGLVLDTFSVEQTVLDPDSKRLAWETAPLWPDGKPVPERPADAAGPRVWYGNGLYAELFRLDEALGLGLGATVDHGDHNVWRDRRGWDSVPFPKTPEALMGYDIVALADVDLKTFTLAQRQWLRGYVQDGGRLLLLGGPYGLGRGFWQDTDLLADVLPVTLEAYDLRNPAAPALLAPVSALAKCVGWKTKAAAFWYHTVKPKPGAVVHLTAGGAPAVVTGSYGQGKVAVIALAPLGAAPKGITPFWDAPEWPRLLVTLAGWLMQ